MRHEERRPEAERPFATGPRKPDCLFCVERVPEEVPGHSLSLAGGPAALGLDSAELVQFLSSEPCAVNCRVDPLGASVATPLVDGVHLPDRRGGLAVVLEQVRDRAGIVPQRIPQYTPTVPAPVVACDDRTPGWHTNRCFAVRSLEADALGRDLVSMRRQGLMVPVASGRHGLVLVEAQEQEVRPR